MATLCIRCHHEITLINGITRSVLRDMKKGPVPPSVLSEFRELVFQEYMRSPALRRTQSKWRWKPVKDHWTHWLGYVFMVRESEIDWYLSQPMTSEPRMATK